MSDNGVAKKNHGTVITSMVRGQSIRETWGKDTGTNYTGSTAQERGKKFGGSTENLSHSLSGVSAKQHVE